MVSKSLKYEETRTNVMLKLIVSFYQRNIQNYQSFQIPFLQFTSMFPKMFLKNLIMWLRRKFDSEQLLILNIMLKIRSYSSGNRRNFDLAYGFSPTKYTFGKDFFTI